MKGLLKGSIDTSITVQLATFLVNIVGLVKPVGPEHFLLKEVLGLETIVQTVQLAFYSWYKYILLNRTVNVAKYRYYDWIITTPLMLFTTLCFYVYLFEREEAAAAATATKPGAPPPATMKSILQENWTPILQIVAFNALMLLMGYLQEIGWLPPAIATPIGFLGLFGSFYTMYVHFVRRVKDKTIFTLMAFLWSLYGGIALLPDVPKNIGFNIIDMFSKNFYGVYLSYYILKL